VPGVLRMLELAHKRHGRLAWAELFEPAVALAERGFEPSVRLAALMQRERFQVPLKNPEYAAVLREIAQEGADAFYRGALTADMVRAVRSHAKPGALTAQDFADYRAVERDPVCGTYRVWRLCSMAPPSSGGVAVLQILGILERTDFARAPPQSAAAVHYFAEAGSPMPTGRSTWAILLSAAFRFHGF
jgi:gamma-glutamyltranspeptidase/glutathione hydrolase